MNDDLDLDAYFDRIGHDGDTRPTRATLEALVERHARALPFENLDTLAGRIPKLDLASLQAKLVAGGRGGYCYEQNGLFLAVLRRLGFDARGGEARIRSGVPAEVVTGRTHMVLRVVLDGVPHLVDVGFGRAPRAPLRLDERGEQRAATGLYRLSEDGDDGGLLLQVRGGDAWDDCYRIVGWHAQAIDYQMANWFTATWPESFLRQHLLLSRAIEGGRVTLMDRRLARRVPESAAAQERTLHTRAEFAAALDGVFGLPVTDADLDAVLAALERLPQ